MASSNQDVPVGDVDDFHDHHHRHLHNMSRLSLCSSSSAHEDASFENDGYRQDPQLCNVHGGTSSMSLMSIESFDADEEFSEDDNAKADQEVSGKGCVLGVGAFSSDSEKETGPYSLPATPPRRRRQRLSQPPLVIDDREEASKEYASENDLLLLAQSATTTGLLGRARSGAKTRRRRRRSSQNWAPISDHTVVTKTSSDRIYRKKEKRESTNGGYFNSSAGESDHSGVLVITRPKGGRRSLCMDLEEVKACNDLGFELEHERMLEILPSGISISTNNSNNSAGGGGSTLDFDTSSGNNSPIANWRISSPGDDPRDVKARLKVWAQAVAFASTSRKGLDFYL